MRSFFAAVFFAAILLGLLAPSARGEPLPTDPRLIRGTLENGMSYVVVEHGYPPGRVGMYLQVATGSLNETEAQRGIAHYLEHMAFNGSENFEPGTVIHFFQSMGMTFGRDQNAFTTFDRTTYILSLPDTRAETIAKGLLFFGDVAWRLSLLPKEIESEREIILEERRRGLSGDQRVFERVIKSLAPGSLIGERLPIGTEETIRSVQREDFVDYYRKWYVPENMTLFVVADAPTGPIIEQIRREFGPMPRRERPEPVRAIVEPTSGRRAIVSTDPEFRRGQIQIATMHPVRPPVTTVARMRESLVESLAAAAFDKKIARKRAEGKLSLLSGGAGVQQVAKSLRMHSVSASSEPGKWREAFADIATELVRARRHGLSGADLEVVKREVLASAERAVETSRTEDAGTMLRRMSSQFIDGEPVMAASQRLEVMRRLLPTITADEVSATFSRLFAPGNEVFIVQLPEGPGAPSEAELLEFGAKALAVEPEADSEFERAERLLSSLPEPGTVVESSVHEPTGAFSAWLSNNVRVHHRHMDYRKGSASIVVTLAGGELLETAENKGVGQAIGVLGRAPATRSHSSTEVRALMAGKKVRVQVNSGPDTVTLNISGSPEDLEAGLQLAYLLITEPLVERASFDSLKVLAKQFRSMIGMDPRLVAAEVLPQLIFPADEARPKLPNEEQIERLTLEASQAWVEKLMRESPIEVAVVGDVDRERAMELVARYIGSLNDRGRISSRTYADLRRVARPAGPFTADRIIEIKAEKAFAFVGFYGADASNVHDVGRLSLAARAISTRMIDRLREKEQLVYSIGAQSQPQAVYPGFGLFLCQSETAPDKVDQLVASVAAMFAEFAADGPTEEELDVVRRQTANSLDESMKDHTFWTMRIQSMEYRGTNLDDVVSLPQRMQAYSREEIRETFARYFAGGRSLITVTVRPSRAGGE